MVGARDILAAGEGLLAGGSPAGWLAANNFGDTRSGGLAGPMGLLIIVLMAIATVLLIRNMNSRLRRLPDRFPDPDEPASPPETAGQPEADPPAVDKSAGTGRTPD
jgi:hypothetical protein